MIGLTSLQLGLFGILFILAFIKLILSFIRSVPFMKMFFIFICLYILAETGLQVYQLVNELEQEELNLYIIIGLNILCVIVGTFIMFLLAEYWKKTLIFL